MAELQLPNLIIAGVHKAGTTSVFTYLSKHPQVCASYKKEIGFFMPLRFNKPIPSLTEYSTYFTHCNANSKYILEASPSYIYGTRKIGEVLIENLKGLKILIILRNPTERLFSFYDSKVSNGFISKEISFKSFAQKSFELAGADITAMNKENELYIRGFEEGCYINYLPYWVETFNVDLKVMFFEDLKKDSAFFMNELCEWLQIDFNYYKPEDFKIENKTTAYKNTVIHKLIYNSYQSMEKFWRKNSGLKNTVKNFYKKINGTSEKRRLSEDDKNYFDTLYQTSNNSLKKYLLTKGMNRFPDWVK